MASQEGQSFPFHIIFNVCSETIDVDVSSEVLRIQNENCPNEKSYFVPDDKRNVFIKLSQTEAVLINKDGDIYAGKRKNFTEFDPSTSTNEELKCWSFYSTDKRVRKETPPNLKKDLVDNLLKICDIFDSKNEQDIEQKLDKIIFKKQTATVERDIEKKLNNIIFKKQTATAQDCLINRPVPKAEKVGLKYVCSVCHKPFRFKYRHDEHVLRHGAIKSVSCPICDKLFFTSGDVTMHLKVHEEPKHECSICKKKFRRLTTKRLHEYIHKPRKERPFKCKVCNDSFRLLYDLRNHESKHLENQSHLCKNCGGTFASKKSLQDHQSMRQQTGKCSPPRQSSGPRRQNNRTYKSQPLAPLPYEAIVLEGDPRFKFGCQICSRKFKTRSLVTSHVLRHTGEKPHKCRFCDFRFVTPGDLQRHEKIHTNDRRFVCDRCGKRFISQKNLRIHVAVIHDAQKNFRCEVCGRSYGYKQNYQAHMDLHYGQKVFQCTQCFKSSSFKVDFGERLKNKNYSCADCNGKLKHVRNPNKQGMAGK